MRRKGIVLSRTRADLVIVVSQISETWYYPDDQLENEQEALREIEPNKFLESLVPPKS
jgi:hypothetical protein